jgi:CelD/BcsL family acetyltransferase involved in cellulose biosynthesis
MTGAVETTLADQVDSVEAEIRVTVAGSFEDLAEVWEEWDEFVEDVGSDVYFTLDWLQVWWSHYGTGRELRCFVIRRGRKMVAALPFCITKRRIGPITVRLARWVGADSTISVLHPAIAAGYESAALEVICRRLLVDERCDAVSLSPLSGLSSVGKAVQEFCGGVDPYCLVRDDSTGPHTIIALPGSFEEYLGTLSKKPRADVLRKARQLSERYGVQHRVVAGEDVGTHYDGFVALHEEQWRAAGRLGHFGDWPDSLAFNRELVARLARKGHVRFYQLCGDGQAISMQFGFVLGDRYYWRLPARRTDPTDDRLALGRVAYVKMLEALIDEGCRMVEAGPGHYDYKLRYGGTEYPLRRQVIARHTWSSRIRIAILMMWSDAVHLVYYRLWFLKLLPRLGIGRPLSQIWIRSRL